MDDDDNSQNAQRLIHAALAQMSKELIPPETQVAALLFVAANMEIIAVGGGRVDLKRKLEHAIADAMEMRDGIAEYEALVERFRGMKEN